MKLHQGHYVCKYCYLKFPKAEAALFIVHIRFSHPEMSFQKIYGMEGGQFKNYLVAMGEVQAQLHFFDKRLLAWFRDIPSWWSSVEAFSVASLTDIYNWNPQRLLRESNPYLPMGVTPEQANLFR